MSEALLSAQASPSRHAGASAYARRRSAKQQEAEVFARATRSLRDAMTGDDTPASPMALARAVADNRRLWDAVNIAVMDPSNQLPRELRAQIASIARAVLRECGAETPDLAFIADMNEQVAGGLWA
ncbi:flagellar biosynthesis regulator FlaF [Rhodovarius lipocyclicus]|uniref:flagellar biosynthesis regulator FlaF n=1 Tax=Rhodovarius lipocyclicus TaxID=268410 RepID=UPI00135B014C|nr:flagellar biosynthesis regulator FlaF [Rhodovarius lipocyclicus]